MKRLYVLKSKVTGMSKRVYAANELEALWLVQEEERGFDLGQVIICPEEKREMKSR